MSDGRRDGVREAKRRGGRERGRGERGREGGRVRERDWMRECYVMYNQLCISYLDLAPSPAHP